MTAGPDPLGCVSSWDTDASAGYVVLGGDGPVTGGPAGESMPWASVSKVVTALATWIAVEERVVAWEDPAGPPGSTLRHLLAHASGLAPDSDRLLAAPGRRRIYSNRGFEVAADHVAGAAGMAFERYATEAVLEPLGAAATSLGNPAHGASGPLSDLLRLAAELLSPTLVDRSTLAEATAVTFPGLPGVLPGFGSFADNTWGLGVEVRDHKAPHWTGRRNSPATFGHFGRSGSFLWVDPYAGVAAASLAARPFGPWAAVAWPALSDCILDAVAGRAAPNG